MRRKILLATAALALCVACNRSDKPGDTTTTSATGDRSGYNPTANTGGTSAPTANMQQPPNPADIPNVGSGANDMGGGPAAHRDAGAGGASGAGGSDIGDTRNTGGRGSTGAGGTGTGTTGAGPNGQAGSGSRTGNGAGGNGVGSGTGTTTTPSGGGGGR